MWKDRFIKSQTDGVPEFGIPPMPVLGQQGSVVYNGSVVKDVQAAIIAADGFRRRGQLLEITWDEFVRHGFLTSFEAKLLRREDAEWEMEFTWISQGDKEIPVAFGFNLSALDIANELLGALQDLIAAVQGVFAIISSVQNAINNLIDTITEAITSIVDLTKQAVNLVMAPIDTAKSMMASFETIKDSCFSLIETVTSLPARAIRQVQDIGTEVQQDVLEAEAWVRRVKSSARALRSIASQRQDEIAADTVAQPAIATVTSREGTDLRTVSTQQYGTPFEWRRIAAYNKLKGSKPPIGKQIFIPRLSSPGK
jgi:hypothetical protein